jgi:hypothetical protein
MATKTCVGTCPLNYSLYNNKCYQPLTANMIPSSLKQSLYFFFSADDTTNFTMNSTNKKISQWNDLSTNNYNLIQTNDALKPIWDNTTDTTKPPFVYFDGTCYFKEITCTSNIVDFTICCVIQPMVNSEYNMIISNNKPWLDGAQNNGLNWPVAFGNNPRIEILRLDQSTSTVSKNIDGIKSVIPSNRYPIKGPYTNTTYDFTHTTIGRWDSSNAGQGVFGYNGRIYNMMMFNKCLTDNETIEMEGYLTWKYFGNTNTLPSTHKYKQNPYYI